MLCKHNVCARVYEQLITLCSPLLHLLLALVERVIDEVVIVIKGEG